MLGHGRVTKVQELRETANRAFAINQLANDQQAMPVGKRLQEIAGLIGCRFHYLTINFHTCVYT